MARHDQKKLFLLACLQDKPLVELLREHKIPLPAWAYLNAIRKHRTRLERIVHSNIKNMPKQKKAAQNKANMFFATIFPPKKQNQDTSPEYYISFLCGLTNTIWWETTQKQERQILAKIEGHLFSIYEKTRRRPRRSRRRSHSAPGHIGKLLLANAINLGIFNQQKICQVPDNSIQKKRKEMK